MAGQVGEGDVTRADPLIGNFAADPGLQSGGGATNQLLRVYAISWEEKILRRLLPRRIT